MTRKKHIILLSALLIIALGSGFALYRQLTTNNIRTEVEVGDTPEQLSHTQEVVTDLQNQIHAAEDSKEPKEKQAGLYRELGANWDSLGKLSEAKAAYEAAIKLEPENGQTYAGLFVVLDTMHDSDKAWETIQKAVQYKPLDPNLWHSLLSYAQYQRHLSDAELKKLYEDALAKTNQDINVVVGYAQFAENSGDLKTALDLWKLAVNIQPNNAAYQAQVTRLGGSQTEK